MRIYIDGDACSVTWLVEKIAKEYGVPVTIVCDDMHNIQSDYSEIIKVPCGKDSTDMRIAMEVKEKDIVVTQDYGAAALVLSKGASAVTKSGLRFTDKNIDRLLFERHVMRIERGKTKGMVKRSHGTKEKKIGFAEALSGIIEKNAGSAEREVS